MSAKILSSHVQPQVARTSSIASVRLPSSLVPAMAVSDPNSSRISRSSRRRHAGHRYLSDSRSWLASTSFASGNGTHDPSDRAHEVGPLRVFPYQVLPARRGELVILGAAIVLGRIPRRTRSSLSLPAASAPDRASRTQYRGPRLRCCECSWRFRSRAAEPGQQRAQHQHVERSLQQVHIERFYMKRIYMSTAYITVVSGTDAHPAEPAAPCEDGADHFRSSAVFLTAAHAKQTSGPDVLNGTSIDQIYAQRFGKDTRLPSVQLCIETLG
jgi:hypothetical protein